MKLYLPRIVFKEDFTTGHLFVNNEWFCYSLEDKVRPKGVKVYGKTAIPADIYEVVVTYSPKFKKMLPLILNVPMYTGIRMHGGVSANNSLGCILLGYNLIGDNHLSLDSASADLTEILLSNKEKHTIEIVNTKEP